MYWDHQKQCQSLSQFWRSRLANKLAGKYGLRQTIRRRQKMVNIIVSYHIFMPIALAEKILISALLLGKYRLLQTKTKDATWLLFITIYRKLDRVVFYAQRKYRYRCTNFLLLVLATGNFAKNCCWCGNRPITNIDHIHSLEKVIVPHRLITWFGIPP